MSESVLEQNLGTGARPGVEEPESDDRTTGASPDPRPPSRLTVLKTYKLYVDGKFPRTESGRYDKLEGLDGRALANVSRGSRKDFREAVVAARAAQPGWAARSAYNRGQILYRIAEMLEGRSAQFIEELAGQGLERQAAEEEVAAAVDRLVYYAGWADKVQQLFSSVNPVSSSHFNFSLLEPTGVVSIVAPEESGLLGLVSVVAPVVTAGNTTVTLASSRFPLTAITFGEVLHSSDVPGGVANLLTGRRDELLPFFASHLDVNAIVYCGDDPEQRRQVQEEAVHNVKRVVLRPEGGWERNDAQSPYQVLDTCEVKTTWHPVGE